MSNYRSGKRYADVLTVLLIIVIIAIIGLLGYFGYKAVDKHNVEAAASSKLEEFKDSIAEANKDKVDNEIEEPSNTTEGNGEGVDLQNFLGNTNVEPPKNENNNSSTTKPARKKVYMGDYEIKGYISIKKTGIEYPILERVTPDSLKKSIAILDIKGCDSIIGDIDSLNVPGTNALILGHNYRNGQFFSDNDKLDEGDKIDITDENGKTVTYTIYKTYYTTENDISFMKRELDPNVREITLQTCNEDSSQRLIIWAKDS